MNARNLLLVSVLLNVGLLAGFALHLNRAPVPTEAKPAPASAPTQVSKRSPASASEPGPKPTATASGEAFNWRSVESDDYKKYIAKLRTIGCPEETIKDILIADVNKLYAPSLLRYTSCSSSENFCTSSRIPSRFSFGRKPFIRS